jgi:hypothetical protein
MHPFVHVLDLVMEAYSGFTHTWVLRDVLRNVPTELITVTNERLDDHLPDGWLPQFVKIDVEGAEGFVLEGAKRIFRLARPTIAFEHGWNFVEAMTVQNDLQTYLRRPGLPSVRYGWQRTAGTVRVL